MKPPVWKTPKPKSARAQPLTPQQKAKAKRTAAAAGRPYPNLVDNMNAAKKR